MAARLKELYNKEIKKNLQKTLNLSNPNQVPVLEKVIVNVGLGKANTDKRYIEVASNTLRKITGQEPLLTKARKSIANFKLREGQINGAKVTLRDEMMYEFIDRLIHIVLPRLRDFQGVNKKSFDSKGNYSLGMVEQSAFPELSFEDINILHGIQITFVTTTDDKEQSQALLTAFGMPFEKGVTNAA